MKNQLFNFLTCAIVLFLVGCSGNPVETPEYKALMTAYEAMVGEQTTAQSNLITAQDVTKKAIAALTGMGEEAGDMKGELLQKATAMLAGNGEALKAHAETTASHTEMLAKHGPEMAMDAIKGDFTKIKEDLTAMIKDYASMTAEQTNIAGAIQSFIASASADAEGEE